MSVLRLRSNLAAATDISAKIASRADQPPMPMTSTLRAQLAGHVHNEPWASNTELKIGTETSNSSQNIPQHVYVSVIQRDLIVSQSIANCKQLNPGFTFHVMDDTDIQKFVEQKAPSLLPIFNQLQGVERSDFWRYLVLWSQGGYYIDSDINCLKPFTAWDDAFLHQAKAIIGIESINPGSNRNHLGFCCPVQYTNWAMASTPGHPLFEHVIDVILDFYAVANRDESSLEAQRRGRDHIVYKTGPGALSRAVEHYLALFDEYSIRLLLTATPNLSYSRCIWVMPALLVYWWCMLVQVPMKEILNTSNFDMERASASAGWLQSFQNQWQARLWNTASQALFTGITPMQL